MKYIKNYNEEFSNKSIEEWCEEFRLKNYTIDDDGTINSERNVDIYDLKLIKIPVKFGIIEGYFDCAENILISLEGSPKKVSDYFDCSYNELKSLKGCPENIGGNFNCSNNKLETFKNGPKSIGGGIDCINNNIISLEGLPKHFNNYLYCNDNPIFEILYIFKNTKGLLDSLDYNYLRGSNIIKLRFEEACEEAGVNVPNYIKGYKYI